MNNPLVADYLADIRQQGLERQRNGHLLKNDVDFFEQDDLQGGSSTVLNVSSNDYLGFSEEPNLKKAFGDAFERYPVGSGGSMVISGCHPCHRRLERAFAEAYHADDALVFPSGYAANLGIIALLAKLRVHIVLDRFSHASFYDGLKLSGASYSRFRHNDTDHLAVHLKQQAAQAGLARFIVITEGIFSMSGQKAPLSAFDQLCKEAQAALIVDEAHSFGILGPQGLGAVVAAQLTQERVPLRVIPFGKALGCQGAIVLGKQDWIDALIQASRSYIYSTAMSPAYAAGLLRAFVLLKAADDKREKLVALIEYFQQHINSSTLQWAVSDTPIQQLQLGCPYKALHFTKELRAKGIFCQALRQPTVSKKETGLRIILTARHSLKDIDCLFDALHAIERLSD